MNILQSIASCMVSVVIMIFFLKKYISESPTKGEKLEMEAKRKEICAIYPSNISERGILCDAEQTLPENMVAYLVAEGFCFYIVRDKDMQTILKIPFIDVIEYRSIKLNRLHETSLKSIPSAVQAYPTIPIFILKFKTNDSNIKTFYFFYETHNSVLLYNQGKYSSPYHYFLKYMNDKK